MSSPLFSAELSTYVESLVPARPAELERMEAYAREHDFPIIGPACGQCCYVLARLVRARRVFELGSGYGYSTAWFARAVDENGGGEVHHVVWDAELSSRARTHLTALGYDRLIRYHAGEAVGILRSSKGRFDIAFLDIDKAGYPDAIAVIEEKLRSGGLLIVDNMLWSGHVFDASDTSAATTAIRKATRLLTESQEWATTIVPMRDGLMVAMKR